MSSDPGVASGQSANGDSDHDQDALPGTIEHVDNSCYAASILTLIAATPGYASRFDRAQNPVAEGPDRVFQAFVHRLVTQVQSGQPTTAEQIQLFIRMLDRRGILSEGAGAQPAVEAQQDAHEVLARILAKMTPVQDATTEVRTATTLDYENPGQANRTETQAQAMLHITPQQGMDGLYEAFANTFDSTRLTHDDNGTPLASGPVERTHRITSLPDPLTILVNQDPANPQPLDMPELLRIPGQFMANGADSAVYRLQAFVVHRGGRGGGHYVAYSRGDEGWTQSDDMGGDLDVSGDTVRHLPQVADAGAAPMEMAEGRLYTYVLSPADNVDALAPTPAVEAELDPELVARYERLVGHPFPDVSGVTSPEELDILLRLEALKSDSPAPAALSDDQSLEARFERLAGRPFIEASSPEELELYERFYALTGRLPQDTSKIPEPLTMEELEALSKEEASPAPSPSGTPAAAAAPSSATAPPTTLPAAPTAKTTGTQVPAAQLGIAGPDNKKPKAGDKDSRKANLALMSAGATDRARKLQQILANGAGNNQAFEVVGQWIMGGDQAELAAAYQQVAGTPLRDAVSTCFSGQKQAYLLDVLDNGEPGLLSRLALSLGLVTDTRADWPEVLRLLHTADAAKIREIQASETLRPALERSRRARAAMDAVLAQDAHDTATADRDEAQEVDDLVTRAQAENRATATGEALQRTKNAELVALVAHRTHRGRGLQRDELIADLQAWAKDQTDEVRRAAVEEGSPFYRALHEQTESSNLMTRLSEADFDYLISIVEVNAPARPELLGPREEPKDEEETEERTKKDQETGDKIADVDAYLARKKASNHALDIQHWSTLKSKIEGMDDEQRTAYLRDQMSQGDREKFDDPETAESERTVLRGNAIQKLRIRLLEVGMKAEVADRVLAAFQVGAAPDSSRHGSTYQQLRRLADGMKRPDFSTRAFRLVGRLSNQEYLQVSRDSDLMSKLEARTDPAVFEQICAIIGYDSDQAVEVAGLDGADARKLGGNQAEFDPAHWTALLQRELGKGKMSRKRDKVMSVATRAFYAARRRAAMPQADEARAAHMPKGLATMDVKTFTNQVLQGLTDEERTTLQKTRAAAFAALSEGRAVTADERIDAASFASMSLKKLKGTGARVSDIKRAIDDARGRELLNQWSNVDDWRELRDERDLLANGAAPRTQEQETRLAELNAELRGFVLDIHPDIHDELRGKLPRGQLVDVLTKLRQKLAAAMKEDDEFKAALMSTGIAVDGYQAERTEGLAAIDQQRLEDTGAQWNSFMGVGISAKSAESKESRNIMAGRLRTAHGTIEKAGDEPDGYDGGRKKVNDEQLEGITEAREEHATRMKAAKELKDKCNEITTTVTSIVFYVAASAATFGAGGLAMGPAAGVILGRVLAAGILKASLQKALQGDRFNIVDTITSTAMDVIITGVAVGAIGGPGLHTLLTQEIGLADKTDAGSGLASQALRRAMLIGASEGIKTGVAAATEADPSSVPLDKAALAKLKAWVQEFALDMANTSAMRELPKGAQAGTQAQQDGRRTAVLTGRMVAAVLAKEAGKPLDAMLEDKRKHGEDADLRAEETGAKDGITPEMLAAGKAALTPTERVEREKWRSEAQNEVAQAQRVADKLRRNLAAYEDLADPALIAKGTEDLALLDQLIADARATLAQADASAIDLEFAARSVRFFGDNADQSAERLMNSALTNLSPPDHDPLASGDSEQVSEPPQRSGSGATPVALPA